MTAPHGRRQADPVCAVRNLSAAAATPARCQATRTLTTPTQTAPTSANQIQIARTPGSSVHIQVLLPSVARLSRFAASVAARRRLHCKVHLQVGCPGDAEAGPPGGPTQGLEDSATPWLRQVRDVVLRGARASRRVRVRHAAASCPIAAAAFPAKRQAAPSRRSGVAAASAAVPNGMFVLASLPSSVPAAGSASRVHPASTVVCRFFSGVHGRLQAPCVGAR